MTRVQSIRKNVAAGCGWAAVLCAIWAASGWPWAVRPAVVLALVWLLLPPRPWGAILFGALLGITRDRS